jgi:hypothetical protein
MEGKGDFIDWNLKSIGLYRLGGLWTRCREKREGDFGEEKNRDAPTHTFLR